MRTRNYFTLCAAFLLFCTTSQAQRRGLLENLYNSAVYYNYDNGSRYSYNYNDNYRPSDDYAYAYDRYRHRMNRHDRKCFDDLLRKLDRRTSRAWEDGYINRWERGRINDVRRELDQLIDRYNNDRRRRDDRRYGNSRNYRSGCR